MAPLSDYVRQQVRTGLEQEALAPVGTGYAQLLAGYASGEGAFGRLEAGLHPAKDLTLFGEAEASSQLGITAGVGARLSW